MKKYMTLFFILTSLLACDITETAKPTIADYSLQLISAQHISVPEPSGLTFDPTNNCLWTVSDETGQIYQLDLNGDVSQILDFVGSDLEGIAFDKLENCLWVVEEEERNLVKVSLEGHELARYGQLIPGYDNSGLEGICLDPESNIFLLKEKNPGQFIQLNPDKSVQKIIELDFAGDYSAIVAAAENNFWILSDQAESCYLYSEVNGISAQLALNIDKPEGIALDAANNDLYIVSDSENKLYHYKLINNSARL
ncbi:MAG: SdiA-regulated domain-containing protein [Candidatus Cloacimonadales bacterium]